MRKMNELAGYGVIGGILLCLISPLHGVVMVAAMGVLAFVGWLGTPVEDTMLEQAETGGGQCLLVLLIAVVLVVGVLVVGGAVMVPALEAGAL